MEKIENKYLVLNLLYNILLCAFSLFRLKCVAIVSLAKYSHNIIHKEFQSFVNCITTVSQLYFNGISIVSQPYFRFFINKK